MGKGLRKLGKQAGSYSSWEGNKNYETGQGLSAVASVIKHEWVLVSGFPEEARGIESSQRHMEMPFVNNAAVSPESCNDVAPWPLSECVRQDSASRQVL